MWEGILRPTHLLVILALAVLFFGPRRFPEFGRVLGYGLKGLRSMFHSKDAPEDDPKNEQPVRRIKGLLRDCNESDQKR
jgi:TatA/E family protein of Tat protein translocase